MWTLIIAPIFFLFLALKHLALGIRMSDTGVYVLTAQALSQGQVLYQDIFFTNAPLYPHIMRFYLWLVQGDLRGVFALAPLEASSIALMLMLIVYKRGVRGLELAMTPLAFLGSFLIFATSDHATGVLTSMVFVVAAWLALTHEKGFAAGILLGVALCIKGYVVPLVFGMTIFTWLTNKKRASQVIIALFITVIMVLMPSLLQAPYAFFDQLFGYSLGRPMGIEKWFIVRFFVTHDWLLIMGIVLSLLPIKPLRIETLAVALQLVFLVLFADVYYYYFNTLAPFAIVALICAIHTLRSKNTFAHVFGIILIIIGVSFSVFRYYEGGYNFIQKINDVELLVEKIVETKPSAVYGDMDIVPALAYMTNVPVVANRIDTNGTFYLTKRLNATTLTQQAIDEGALIITHGAYYPEDGVDEPAFSLTVDKSLINQRCVIQHRHPVRTESASNQIVVWACE
ncbi:MAG TPA: hypothetical protein PKG71_04200 [Candidatus Woesebacteria bacterium]|nr:hypothetical protein [Candidatus Woesebacteria bacterium]HNS95141.1 hypothetical protein [Candidatus Woesebacteria bacterium]